jgi:hypothetical protein
MKTTTTYICETCGEIFTVPNRCEQHEEQCEKYSVGDRVEVYHCGKW